MKKMRSLLVVCVSILSAMTISAQSVSFSPNWKSGDKVTYSFAQKEVRKSGAESSTVEKAVVLNLKVVSKSADGYIMNATYENPVEKGSDEMSAALFKLNDGLSFDYKLDASGKLIGLVDSAKVVSDMKELMEKAAKVDQSLALALLFAGASLSDDMYLAGLLDEVCYIHSLNNLTLEPKKTVEQKNNKTTIFGFSVLAPYQYTLQSVNGNVVNVKSSAVVNNDVIMPAFVDFSIQMMSGVMNNMSAMFAKEGEQKVDMNEIMKQRTEIEKKFKETFDMKITDNFTYSYDKSTHWMTSVSGSSVVKGKAEDKNIDVTTETKITKK